MASEMINQVLDAEKTAADKEAAARAKAAEIVKAAEAEAKATAEAGKVAAAKEKEQILSKAQKKRTRFMRTQELRLHRRETVFSRRVKRRWTNLLQL